MKKKPASLWVARNPEPFGFEGFYKVYTTKPKKSRRGEYSGSDHSYSLGTYCPKKFEKFTGFKMERGKCKRVTIKFTEVKPRARSGK
jgi:hypothetical protein